MCWKAIVKPQMRENYFALALWQQIEASNTLKYKHLTKKITAYVEYKNQSDNQLQ